ncbi:synaptotagmin-like protein 2 isoform X2 [Polypterus senegalus]|uniref:synaptotagmin-like protein 2 isoform X2 n=1 Tax=Polypterus senegalus TaxID=55291 RepID=UPI0019648FFC|nr:synaptotagmin-like protein 2 isoform X2 [Polypterus senegalus]
MKSEWDYSKNLDLSFLSSEEENKILQVLERDARLKNREKSRVRQLRLSIFDPRRLKIMTGEWFDEIKSRRYNESFSIIDIVRCSFKRKANPALTSRDPEETKVYKNLPRKLTALKEKTLPLQSHTAETEEISLHVNQPKSNEHELAFDQGFNNAETTKQSIRKGSQPTDAEELSPSFVLSAPAAVTLDETTSGRISSSPVESKCSTKSFFSDLPINIEVSSNSESDELTLSQGINLNQLENSSVYYHLLYKSDSDLAGPSPNASPVVSPIEDSEDVFYVKSQPILEAVKPLQRENKDACSLEIKVGEEDLSVLPSELRRVDNAISAPEDFEDDSTLEPPTLVLTSALIEDTVSPVVPSEEKTSLFLTTAGLLEMQVSDEAYYEKNGALKTDLNSNETHLLVRNSVGSASDSSKKEISSTLQDEMQILRPSSSDTHSNLEMPVSFTEENKSVLLVNQEVEDNVDEGEFCAQNTDNQPEQHGELMSEGKLRNDSSSLQMHMPSSSEHYLSDTSRNSTPEVIEEQMALTGLEEPTDQEDLKNNEKETGFSATSIVINVLEDFDHTTQSSTKAGGTCVTKKGILKHSPSSSSSESDSHQRQYLMETTSKNFEATSIEEQLISPKSEVKQVRFSPELEEHNIFSPASSGLCNEDVKQSISKESGILEHNDNVSTHPKEEIHSPVRTLPDDGFTRNSDSRRTLPDAPQESPNLLSVINVPHEHFQPSEILGPASSSAMWEENDIDLDDDVSSLSSAGSDISAKKQSSSSGLLSVSGLSGSMMSLYSDAGDFGNLTVQGGVQFALIFNAKKNELVIYIEQCQELAIGNVKKQRTDPYVKTYLYPDRSRLSKRKTSVKKNTVNPIYRESLTYIMSKTELQTRTLNLSVWHNDSLGRNAFLGEVQIDLQTWDWSHDTLTWYSLLPKNADVSEASNRGHLVVALKYVPPGSIGPTRPATGELHVWLKEARKLQSLKPSGVDSFVKCYILPDTTKKSRQKTRVIKKNLSPVYNHTMVYDGFKHEEIREASCELTIWDHETFSNQFLGGVRLSLGTGRSYGRSVDWMDSADEEVELWKAMISKPNEWVEAVLPLRSSMTKKT